VCGNDRKDELIRVLREQYGRPREESLEEWHRKYKQTRRAEVEGEAVEKRDTFPIAEALWAAASESKETPAAYLNGRGITWIPDGVKLVSRTEVGKIARRFSSKRLKPYPTMVVRIVDETGKMMGVQATALSFDANEKLSDDARTTFGERKGGYVVLGKPDPNRPLIVAEGVETVLSAMQLTGVGGEPPLPGVALLGSDLEPIKPPLASRIIFAADNDEAGQKVVGRPGRRLRWNDASASPVRPQGP
jgi:hypothetical protein